MVFIQTLVKFMADVPAQVQCGGGTVCDPNLPNVAASSGNLQSLLQIFFAILAVVAVLIIMIWGGLRFITESGNPQEMTKARNTIIYASIGLVIALSGEIIVSFVLRRL